MNNLLKALILTELAVLTGVCMAKALHEWSSLQMNKEKDKEEKAKEHAPVHPITKVVPTPKPATETAKAQTINIVKRGRGRPRKNPLPA